MSMSIHPEGKSCIVLRSSGCCQQPPYLELRVGEVGDVHRVAAAVVVVGGGGEQRRAHRQGRNAPPLFSST